MIPSVAYAYDGGMLNDARGDDVLVASRHSIRAIC